MLKKYKQTLKDKHVIITGGSSGIGLAVAKKVAILGANVTIIARNKSKLSEAKLAIEDFIKESSQNVIALSADVGDYESLKTAIDDSVTEHNAPPFMVVCCAGLSNTGTLESLTQEEIMHENSVNYLGTVFTVQSCLPHMKSRNEGKIVLVSSLAGMIGLYGYTTYSATKFALRGFAEALTMELKGYNITVTVSLPPNTNTPGHDKELLSMPLETKLLSNTADTVDPDVVAEYIIKDGLLGKFYSTVDFEGQMLTTGNPGMSPPSSCCELVTQIMFSGVLRLVSVLYLFKFYRIIANCKKDKNSLKKAE